MNNISKGYDNKLAVSYAAKRKNFRSSDKFLITELNRIDLKNKVVLDFGCGDGAEAPNLLKLGAKRVIGIDPSSSMIRLAKSRKLKKAAFESTDGKRIPLKDNSIDLVYSRFVLHYIEDIPGQMKEISRVMKPDSYFAAIFQCLTTNKGLLNKEVPITLGKGSSLVNIVILSKSPQEIQEVLLKAGLIVEKFLEVHNPDSAIDPKYKNKYKFVNNACILVAKKV